jgi:hypothetical protein
MPGVALHFVVAERTLESIRDSGGERPFDLDDPAPLNAYFHGAVGPDLGYFPGGWRVLSDLSHCVRTGALARALIRGARTELERAFALGWLTHVLADREIHPWIGRGVGEHLTGDRDRFVDGSSRPLEHLRVEMGVDAWFAARHPTVRARRLQPAFDEVGIGFLVGAYARTYGVAIPAERFLTSHRATAARASQGLATIGVVGALVEDCGYSQLLPGVRWVLQRAYEAAPLRGVSLAYLNPVKPSEWLLDAICSVVDAHAPRCAGVAATGGATLGDYNLDTGRLSVVETDHPGTERALDALRDLQAAARGLTPVATGARGPEVGPATLLEA